jgi:acyl-ACP thioesterase
MQEIATRHAHTKGFGTTNMHARNMMWVVTRFEIQVLNTCKWNDEIIIETWSRGLVDTYAYREFILYKMVSGERKPLGKASSSWVALDMVQRKPVAFQDENIEKNSLKEKTVGIAPRKINFTNGSADTIALAEMTVRNSDLDTNNHTNNTKYVQWVYDSLTQADIKALPKNGFAINYSSEALLGDQVYLFKKDNQIQARSKSDKVIFTCEFF